MSEEVIELSVEETNKLRIELGLTPLRGVVESSSSISTNPTSILATPPFHENGGSTLELSVDETNDLREKLGLKPLRNVSEAVHKPAENERVTKELQERLQKEKLKRQVEQGIASTFGTSTLADDEGGDALSWAQQMRAESQKKQDKPPVDSKKKKKKKREKSATPNVFQNYDEEDLEGINVSHAASDFDAGSTTILTLADTSLLKTKSDMSSKVVGLNNEDANHLENVELADRQQQRDRLREKRQVDMGLGRAGGYAGFDDDEFEELGGVSAPSNLARGMNGAAGGESKEKRRGFQIGSAKKDADDVESNGLFAFQSGKAISLEQSEADVAGTDFLTAEEDAALNGNKKKKDAKFKKKKNKRDKKNKRRADDEDDAEHDEPKPNSILEELEQTSVALGKKRKRRRDEDDDDGKTTASTDFMVTSTNKDETTERRARFDEIMEKGNEQTKAVFSAIKEVISPAVSAIDEEPDDNFLNEALAKARRLRKLREMSTAKPTFSETADTIAQAVQESKQKDESSISKGGITFAVDETREFTRALLARQEKEARQKMKKQLKAGVVVQVKKEDNEASNEDSVMEDADAGNEASMEELAKQVKDDVDYIGMDGTGDTITVGRGMAGVLSMLRHTGEISGRNAGREEMRGRAKDERTYEDYAPLNLSEVVRIGEGANEKDREFASREIKLDYRDEHGRLLTRKEAYRNLCYQFHGHGSSAKNEERRLRQVEREQAEARLASRQAAGAGSLGALKATQKATGKAYVVHKT